MDNASLTKAMVEDDKINSIYYKDDDESISKWKEILNNNDGPSEIIKTYTDAICKDNNNKGYCDLLNLFKILGALEHYNKCSTNPALTDEEKQTCRLNLEKLKKEKDEDLVKIHNAIKDLLENVKQIDANQTISKRRLEETKIKLNEKLKSLNQKR
jgi:hypothetical protein